MFPFYIVDELIKRAIKKCNQQNKDCNFSPKIHIYQTFLPQSDALRL